MEREFDFLFKLILIGDSGVGKGFILHRFTESDATLTTKSKSTIGVEFGVRTIDIEGKKIKLQVWDTAGQERYKAIITAYFRDTMGLVVVYSITMRSSFENIRQWREIIVEQGAEDLPTVLVGHHFDVENCEMDCEMENERVLSYQEGLEVAKMYNWTFFEISSKSYEDVDRMFTLLAKKCLVKIENHKPNTLPPVTLSPQVPQGEHQVGIFKRGFLKVKNRLFESKPNDSGASNIDTIDKPNRQQKHTESRINNLDDELEPEAYIKTIDSIEPCIKPKENEQNDNMIEPESCQNLSPHPPLGEHISGETPKEMSDVIPRHRVDSLQFPEPVNPEYTHTRTINTVEKFQPYAGVNEINSRSEVKSCVLFSDNRLPVEDIDETEYFDDNQFS